MYLLRRHYGIKICEIWFEKPQKLKKSLIYDYNCMNSQDIDRKKLISQRDGLTLVNDLSEDEEAIFSHFGKNVKYEIKRAYKENIQSQFFFGRIENFKEIIPSFDKEYLKMYAAKGMKMKSIKNNLFRMAKNHCLMISTASDQEGMLVYHAYIIGNNVARFQYSVSVFRNVEDKSTRQTIARANRMLHFEDMKWLKKNGITQYDWGGYSRSEELAGINAFKLAFGGEMCEKYFYKEACSEIIARILKMVRK